MKPTNLLIATLLSCVLLPARVCAQETTLSNQSVIEMIEMEFDEEIIVSKIEASDCQFNTSIEELKRLKGLGVPSRVIVAMVKSDKAEKEKREAGENAVSGIFYTDDSGELRKIYPTAFSGSKNNMLGAALSYGIVNATVKATMPGASSPNVLHTLAPKFYFFFSKDKGNPSISDWWFSAATSPHQFSLVRLEAKKNSRRLETGRANLFTGNSSVGVDEDNSIPFHIKAVNDYEFEVIVGAQLEPGGEYCFIYKGIVPNGGYSNQAVFDFSIPEGLESTSRFNVGNEVHVKDEKGKTKPYLITKVLISPDGKISYEGKRYNGNAIYQLREEDCSLEWRKEWKKMMRSKKEKK